MDVLLIDAISRYNKSLKEVGQEPRAFLQEFKDYRPLLMLKLKAFHTSKFFAFKSEQDMQACLKLIPTHQRHDNDIVILRPGRMQEGIQVETFHHKGPLRLGPLVSAKRTEPVPATA